MKRIISTCFLLLLLFSAFAQNSVRVNVVIPPPYPDYLSYYREPGRMVITLQNLTNTRQEVYLRGQITGIDNARQIYTKPEYRPGRPIVIPAGQVVMVSAEEIMELYKPSNLVFNNTDSARIAAVDRVGEGTYAVCVQAYDYQQFNKPLSPSNAGCATIFMRNLEAPMLIQPQEEQKITATGAQNIIFSWTRPAGAPLGTTYEIKLVEMHDPNRNTNDAYNSGLPFFRQEVANNVFVYGPGEPPLVPGRKYAWAVTALDPDRFKNGKYAPSLFQNGGRSEVRAFTYQNPILPTLNLTDKPSIQTQTVVVTPTTPPQIPPTPMVIKSAPIDPVVCECKENIPQGTAAEIAVGDEVKVGSFTMKVTGIEHNENGAYKGTGTIPIPLINSSLAKLRVRFFDMEVVNAGGAKTMIAGEVKGMRRNDMSILPTTDAPGLSPAPLSSSEINQIGAFFEQRKDQLVSSLKNSANNIGFELPIGLDEGPITIGITEIFFTPTQAWFNAVASMDIPDGNSKAAFEMVGGCMKSTDLCKEFKIRLKEDLNVPSIGMKLVQGDLNGKGTYLIMEKKGFKELSLAIDYTFNGGLKKVQGGGDLVARLNARSTEGWSNWVAEATMDDFYIEGMNSITFSLGGNYIAYDHSDKSNPTNLPPNLKVGNETYTDVNVNTWHGFYLPKLIVTLPSIVKNGSNPEGKLSIEAKNFIIDKNGITGSVANATTPIISIGNGNLQGWYASVDHFTLDLFKSGFRKSLMTGKLVLPGTGSPTDIANQMNYHSHLTYAPGSGLEYEFVIAPKDQLRFKALYAVLRIEDNSSISISKTSENGFLARTDISGKFSFEDVLSESSVPLSIHLPELRVEHFKLQTQYPYWDKRDFVLKFNSAQKKIAGFDFTIRDLDLAVTPTQDEAVLAGISFNGQLSLINEPFASNAAASATVGSKFTLQNNRIVWNGVGGKINDVSFAAGTQLGPATIEGAIMYYNKDGDEGFIGALSTSIAEIVSVSMRARFGNKRQGNSSYPYFDFNALVDLQNTGLPFAPPIPLALYGFGGGFYYNMKPINTDILKSKGKSILESATSQTQPTNDQGANSLLNYNPAGLQLEPAKGYFGLQATVLIGLTNRNTLDADATLSMGFTPRGGVEYIRFNANARILTDISKPLHSRDAASTGFANMDITYDFENKKLSANLSITLGVPTFELPQYIYAYGLIEVQSDPEGWHIYAGRPLNIGMGPHSVRLLRKDLVGGSPNDYFFSGWSYFEVGSRVDNMPEIPQEILDYAGAQSSKINKPETSPNRGIYRPNGKNSGIIFGSRVDFTAGGQFLMFFGTVESKAGFDISITKGINCSYVKGAGGPGGWYAQGNAYMGARAKIGVELNLLLIKGKFTIFDAGAGAGVRVGLPNPTYVDGFIGGYFKILDGAVSGNFTFRVSLGTKCEIPGDPLAGLEIISEDNPVEGPELVPVNSIPTVLFNIKLGRDLAIEDFTNVDDKGQPKWRFFRFSRDCVEATLKEEAVEHKVQLKNIGTGNDFDALFEPVLPQSMKSDYLTKNKKYEFKVIAYMKEAKLTIKNGRPTVGQYYFIKNDGTLDENGRANKSQRAQQEARTRFTTDDGLKIIPEQDYKLTTPIHGRKAQFYSYDDNFLIKLNKHINFENNFAYFNSKTKLLLRVYENGQQVGADLPISVRQGFELGKHTDLDAKKLNVALSPYRRYTALVIAKIEGSNAKADTSSESANVRYAGRLPSTESLDVSFLKFGSNRKPRLVASEQIIGGYNFETSYYLNLGEKTAAVKANSVKIDLDEWQDVAPLNIAQYQPIKPATNTPSLRSRAIDNNTDQATTRKILDSWLPKDKNGNYLIVTGEKTNFPAVAELSGERFSVVDNTSTNSSPTYHLNPLHPQWMEKVLSFLAQKAGYPKEKFILAEGRPPLAVGADCQTSNGSTLNIFNLTQVGGAHPTEVPLPLPIPPNLGFSNNGMTTLSNLSLSSSLSLTEPTSVRIIKFTHSGFDRRCRDFVNLPAGGPVQKIIDRVINSRINPGDNVITGMANVGIWREVHNAVSNFGKGLNTQQLEGKVQGIINR